MIDKSHLFETLQIIGQLSSVVCIIIMVFKIIIIDSGFSRTLTVPCGIRSLDHPDSEKTAATHNKDVYGRTHSVDDRDSWLATFQLY